MRFTTKQLLVAILAIAFVLVSLHLVERAFSPDPRSESFVVLDTEFSPEWAEAQPKPRHATVVPPSGPMISEDGYDGPFEMVFDQPLFRYSYSDYLGRPAFEIRYRIAGHAASDWSGYHLLPVVSGGGNVGASCEIGSSFDPDGMILRVNIHQQFAADRIAKTTALAFAWHGTRFVRRSEKIGREY